MNEERPIVFTITNDTAKTYRIYTNDSRADGIISGVVLDNLTELKTIRAMWILSTLLNTSNYATLFEVE